jgi:hypothetical protein
VRQSARFSGRWGRHDPAGVCGVNADEITDLLPRFLETRYGNSVRRAGPPVPAGMADPGGWLVQDRDLYCFARASRASSPFIWLRLGIALEIPRSCELAYFVAGLNKDVSVGRVYMTAGEMLAGVVLDETILAAYLDWDHRPSIQDLVDRFENAMNYSRALRPQVLEQFGGDVFRGEAWSALVF